MGAFDLRTIKRIAEKLTTSNTSGMAACRTAFSLLSRRLTPTRSTIVNAPLLLPFLCPLQQSRGLRTSPKSKEKGKKKKKKGSTFRQYDLKDAIQFSLCDAMRYIRAFEVGRPPTSSKYEVHLKLKTKKDGPIVRNQIRLPHSVKTNIRICVICPPDSPAAESARRAGAVLVGEENVFEAVQAGKIDFDRCLCHPESLAKMNKAGLGRILGPRGLMPSPKLGTVVDSVGPAVRNMLGGSVYRERSGVVRIAVGQLGFTPEEMRTNIRAFMDQVKKDIAGLSDQIPKDIAEVVLSSTNSPGFSLTGEFRTKDSPSTQELSTL